MLESEFKECIDDLNDLIYDICELNSIEVPGNVVLYIIIMYNCYEDNQRLKEILESISSIIYKELEISIDFTCYNALQEYSTYSNDWISTK